MAKLTRKQTLGLLVETMTAERAAGYAGMDYDTFCLYCKQNKIPGAKKVGNTWEVPMAYAYYLRHLTGRDKPRYVVDPAATSSPYGDDVQLPFMEDDD